MDDDAQLAPLRIEAEDTVFSTFQVEGISSASGEEVLKFAGTESDEVGTLTLAVDTLTGFMPGEYDVVVATFDMLFAGGQAATTFSVELTEETTTNGAAVMIEPVPLEKLFLGTS